MHENLRCLNLVVFAMSVEYDGKILSKVVVPRVQSIEQAMNEVEVIGTFCACLQND